MTIARKWRKSTYSGQESECVELPDTLDAIRDSKNGQVLPLSRQAVDGLLTAVKQG